jgi:hypothetical protein
MYDTFKDYGGKVDIKDNVQVGPHSMIVHLTCVECLDINQAQVRLEKRRRHQSLAFTA